MQKHHWHMLIWFVAGLIVGLAISLFFIMRTPAEVADTDIGTSTADTVADEAVGLRTQLGTVVSDPETNFIHVKDQQANSSVFVSRVSLSEPGWVVIHEVENGDFGNILGAKRFDAGEYQGAVPLLRDTEANNTYYAALYVDDGDRMFDFTKDKMAVDQSGQPIFMTFEVY